MFENSKLNAIVAASDLERAKKWYSEKLGLEPLDGDAQRGVRYKVGGTMLLLYESEFAGTNKATAAGFEVEDFDGAIEKLRSNGVTFEDVDFGPMGSTVDGVMEAPDGSEKIAWFKDSEGNILAVATQR